MRSGHHSVILLLFLLAACPGRIAAQAWEFVKEKDGIRLYTRTQPGSSLKSFKGIMDLRVPVEKVYDLIGNVKNVDWWDKNVKEIRVLSYEKEKHSQYYLVYDAPWPVTDRDLCVDATITTDPATGFRTVKALPMPDLVPENPDRIRIRNYWQSWTIEPRANGVIHITLEGFVDPAGSVPDWVYNMVITGTPYKVMNGIRERLEKK